MREQVAAVSPAPPNAPDLPQPVRSLSSNAQPRFYWTKGPLHDMAKPGYFEL